MSDANAIRNQWFCFRSIMAMAKQTEEENVMTKRTEEENVMTKLKPCPFCGMNGRIIKRKSKLWDVGCENMDCAVWVCLDKSCKTCLDGHTAKVMAVTAWNRRVK